MCKVPVTVRSLAPLQSRYRPLGEAMTLKTVVRSVTPRTRLQTAVATAIVVASLTAGVSYASIPDSGGVIHGCYKPSNKATPLKVIDTARTSKCPNGYDSIVWNQTGPQGPVGPQGQTGATGATGQQGPPGPAATCAGIPHVGIDLSGCDLEGANLGNVNLTNANLAGADLSDGGTLDSSNLSGVDLSNSNLSGVDLDETDLADTDLSNADLYGVASRYITGTPSALPPEWQLAEGYLIGPGAQLSGATLEDLNLSGADLNGVNLEYAEVYSDNLTGASLIGANLTGVFWNDDTCPDGTNSDNDGDTCINNLG